MLAKMSRALRSYSLTASYLVGVSGRRDSVALLYGLVELGFQRLIVYHLQSCRSVKASADARFVERLAARLNLICLIEYQDAPAICQQHGLPLEAARYKFFARIVARRRCHAVILAHQADDQVETFLLNVLRGTEYTELVEMRLESQYKVHRRQLTVVRPLLSVWPEEINDFLKERKLRWREVYPNAGVMDIARNRLRSEILPLLAKTLGREVKPALWRTADILGAESDWLASLRATKPPSFQPC